MIEKRDAEEFNEEAVKDHLEKHGDEHGHSGPVPVAPMAAHPHAHEHGPGGGCPGAQMIQFDEPGDKSHPSGDAAQVSARSELRQWPIQLHLVPPTAPYFKKADVLLAADCVAFAIGDFHSTHLKDRALAIACPKLDQGMEIYLNKLVAMIDEAQINSLIVMIMQVPCCSGLVQLAKEASERANRKIPVKQMIVGLRGEILQEEWV